MIKNVHKIILVVMAISFGFVAKAQDPHFSQFYANPLYLNPAFTGNAVCPRLMMNYRNQWPSIPGAYVTHTAGFDAYFPSLHGGLGLLAMSDRCGEGALTDNQISALYSFHIQASKKFFINLGAQATFYQYSIDRDKITFGDQIDPQWGFVYNSDDVFYQNYSPSSGLDISAGAVGYSKQFYAGVAVHHLANPNRSLMNDGSVEMAMKFTVQTGGRIYTEKKKRHRSGDPYFSPNFVFMKQGPYEQFNYGCYFTKEPMSFGLWYRHFLQGYDALAFMVGFEHDQRYKFSYSYDITMSGLGVASGGAHEISIGIMFNCHVKKPKVHKIVCPSFN